MSFKTPQKASEDKERSPEDILSAIEKLKERDPIAAERVAALCLSMFGGYKIIENKDGSCSVLSNNSDTPRNPYEAFVYGVRKRIQMDKTTENLN